MKGGILAFLAGVGTAVGIAALRSNRLAPRAAAGLATLDLNSAPAEAFVALGLSQESCDRIIDNRPYRTRIELLERFVIPEADYEMIRDRVSTDRAHTNDAVRVAS